MIHCLDRYATVVGPSGRAASVVMTAVSRLGCVRCAYITREGSAWECRRCCTALHPTCCDFPGHVVYHLKRLKKPRQSCRVCSSWTVSLCSADDQQSNARGRFVVTRDGDRLEFEEVSSANSLRRMINEKWRRGQEWNFNNSLEDRENTMISDCLELKDMGSINSLNGKKKFKWSSDVELNSLKLPVEGGRSKDTDSLQNKEVNNSNFLRRMTNLKWMRELSLNFYKPNVDKEESKATDSSEIKDLNSPKCIKKVKWLRDQVLNLDKLSVTKVGASDCLDNKKINGSSSIQHIKNSKQLGAVTPCVYKEGVRDCGCLKHKEINGSHSAKRVENIVWLSDHELNFIKPRPIEQESMDGDYLENKGINKSNSPKLLKRVTWLGDQELNYITPSLIEWTRDSEYLDIKEFNSSDSAKRVKKVKRLSDQGLNFIEPSLIEQASMNGNYLGIKEINSSNSAKFVKKVKWLSDYEIDLIKPNEIKERTRDGNCVENIEMNSLKPLTCVKKVNSLSHHHFNSNFFKNELIIDISESVKSQKKWRKSLGTLIRLHLHRTSCLKLNLLSPDLSIRDGCYFSKECVICGNFCSDCTLCETFVPNERGGHLSEGLCSYETCSKSKDAVDLETSKCIK